MTEDQRFTITVDDADVRGVIHPPRGGKAPHATVLFCRGVTAHGTAIDTLFDDLTDALTDSGVACADFEPRCASLILEEFESYGALEYLADVSAFFEYLRSTGAGAGPLGVIGYDDGAIGAACLAGRTQHIDQLCLLAPAIGESRHPRSPKPEDDDSGDENAAPVTTDLPSRYVESMSNLAPLEEVARFEGQTMIVHGAADRVVAPETSFRYASAILQGGHVPQLELIVRGDHHFTVPETRVTCLTRVMRYFESLPRSARRRRSA